MSEVLRLHVGGEEPVPGWKILNLRAAPGVDYVADCTDLGMFGDASVDDLYASHVLEHLPYLEKLPRALSEFHRVLKPGARARISVPDLEVLCRLFLDSQAQPNDRILVMRMMFGGQLDANDFHYVGLSFDILSGLLRTAGFRRLERVAEFGLFNDTSSLRMLGSLVSLNVVAYK